MELGWRGDQPPQFGLRAEHASRQPAQTPRTTPFRLLLQLLRRTASPNGCFRLHGRLWNSYTEIMHEMFHPPERFLRPIP